MSARAEAQAVAEGLGWIGVGLANAPLVALLGAPASFGERVTHHLVDLGHFAILGALAALLRGAASETTRRFALGRISLAALGISISTAIAAWALREDLAGFLERMQLPSWVPARLGIALGFGALYIAVATGLTRVTERLPTWTSAVGTFALVAAANLALPPDYPGLHFFVLACAARLGTLGVLRVLTRRSPSRRAVARALGALGAAAIASVSIRPPPSIWRRVFDVPCSIAPVLLGPVLSPSHHARGVWVPPESAAWFEDRSKLPSRPPFPRPLVPKNAIVILVTIDALRADVALNGEHDDALPELARARERSVRFVAARSPSPSTLTSAMALFTGKYYSQTYWTKVGNSVTPTEDDSVRFTSLLSERGVRTVHALALRGLSRKTGVGRGFDVERQTKKDYGRAHDLMKIVMEEVTAFGDGPGFVYAHFIDSHAPYNLAGKDGSLFERYLGELGLVDRELGRLRKLLSRPGLRERTVLIVSADHGEAFGEHGMNYHARSVYEELLRVPLFVALPHVEPREVRVPVSLIDLGPTILDLFGTSTPGDSMGESLVPLLAGESMKPTRPLVADSGRRLQAMLFPGGVKVIRDLTHRTIEVYDLERDPEELQNLMGDDDFPADRYAAALEAFFEVHTLRREGWEPPWRKF